MERKLISFSREVYDRLTQEPRGTQSALIDALLANHYEIELTGDDKHALMRSQIQQSLRKHPEDEELANQLLDETETDVVPQPEIGTPENPGSILADLDYDLTDEVDALTQPTSEPDLGPDFKINVADGTTPTDETPVEPATPEEPTTEAPAEPVAVAVTPLPTEVCPKCGQPKLLPTCLNCEL